MSKTDTPNLTIDEKLAMAKEVAISIEKATTAADLTSVIKDNYGQLGHKVVNRLILGQTPETALRIDSKK
jgi:hypothetical protein